MERNPEIAATILRQMGGIGRIRAMTGAKNFIDYGNGVSFQFPNKAAGRPNLCKVTLRPEDTYLVEFGRHRGTTYKVLKTLDGVYGDMLKSLFEQESGLYLSFR